MKNLLRLKTNLLPKSENNLRKELIVKAKFEVLLPFQKIKE
jgi:hypothetical protein